MNTEQTTAALAEAPFFLRTESLGVASPSVSLTLPERAAAALKTDEVKAKIKEAVAASADIVEVVNLDGRTQAHRIGMTLTKLGTAIQATGKAAREDAQAFSKAVITQENELLAMVKPEKERVLGLRDAFDERVRLEEEARAKAEKDRVERIETALSAMRAELVWASGKTAAQILEKVEAVSDIDMSTEFWQEYLARAIEVQAGVLAQLLRAHGAQLAVEQEAARVKAEQEAEAKRVAEQALENARIAAELKKQQDALAERERIATAERLAAAYAAASELERVQNELKAAQAKLDADRKAFEEKQQAVADQAAADAAAEVERQEKACTNAVAELIDPAVEITEVPVDPAPRDESHLRVLVDRQTPEGATPAQDRTPINPQGQYYSTTTFKDNGKPILCNADGTRSIFCDVDDDEDEPAALPLSFAYDEIADVLTVEGINYHGEIFRQLGGMLEVGAQFTLVAREDGVLTILKGE